MSHAPTHLKRHARELRRSPTRAEARLWSWLRNRRFVNLKFRRQVPVGRYILDFYCAELKLAIEVDGAHHNQVDMADYDSMRTYYLERRGIYVLRIPNELIVRDPEMVGEVICFAVSARPPHPPPAPSPPRRGGEGSRG